MDVFWRGIFLFSRLVCVTFRIVLGVEHVSLYHRFSNCIIPTMSSVDPSSWKTQPRLLSCLNPECGVHGPFASDSDVTFQMNDEVPFMADGVCNMCDHKFTVCTMCRDARTQYSSKSTILSHCRNMHTQWHSSNLARRHKRKYPTPLGTSRSQVSRSRSVTENDTPGSEEDVSVDTSVADAVEAHTSDTEADDGLPLPRPNLYKVVNRREDIGGGCRLNSAAYFYHESKDIGSGLQYLVGKARFKNPCMAGLLDPDEVMMYAQTAELANQLTRPNRDRLAHLTKSIVDVVRKQTVEESEVLAGIRPRRAFVIHPLVTPNEIRGEFFENVDALFNILPHPPLFECEDHAYSLYSDCVRDALGKGYDLDFVPKAQEGPVVPDEFPLRDIKQTSQCKTIFNIQDHRDGNSSLVFYDLWMNEWSDDADPNNSIKNNRGSLWFKSVTISPTRDMIHSMSHTYPLALGHKNADHEHVGRLLREDLLSLGAREGVPMYSKRHGGIVLVRARLLACLQDQPERRGENHLMGGGSDMHRRFGYSFPWHKFGDVLRPCQACRAILLDESIPWVCPDCAECTNFALNPRHPLLVYEAPADFPLYLENDEKLPPTVLTYESLVSGVTLTHQALVEGWWCSEEAKEWLKWHCLNLKTQGTILLHAERCKEYRDIMDDPLSTDAEKNAVENEREREPSLYLPWPIPSLWNRGVLLNQCPDVPMHLLFLGCVKTVMLRVQAWMSNKRKASPFAREMKRYMESLDELKLTWMKILPYKGGKFGGWVSENYVAMSRIMKWFYSSLDRLASDEELWVEPVDKPQIDWKALDNRAWLTQRGLDDSGLADPLRARVKHYMDQTPVPPVVEMQAGSVETVLLTISSLDDLISLVMIDEIPNHEYYTVLERKIRIFLTHFADMEDKLPRKKQLPQWLSAYNFLSLLNLPDVVRQYGPIRNIWEGGPQGEGVLRFVKPNMLNGMRRAWEISTMKTLMRKKAMQYVMDPTLGTAEYRGRDGRDDTKLVYCYNVDIVEVDNLLRDNKKILSCVQIENGQWGMVWMGGRVRYFVALTMSPLARSHFGLNYYSWHRALEQELEPLEELTVVATGLLLPLQQPNLNVGDEGFVTHCYALTAEDHRSLGVLGVLTFT